MKRNLKGLSMFMAAVLFFSSWTGRSAFAELAVNAPDTETVVTEILPETTEPLFEGQTDAVGKAESPVSEEESDTRLWDVVEEEWAADLVIEEEIVTARVESEERFFTLFFDYNDGSGTVIEQRVYEGEVTVEPEEKPKREGWLFEGWYNDGQVGRQFSFGGPLYADQTVYAHWSRNDWKIDRWFTQLVRGGANIAYDDETHTLTFGAGELILNRQDSAEQEAGYYLGYRITAPLSVTETGEVFRIEINGVWQDFNGPSGIYDGVDEDTGCLYLNVYEPVDLAEIKALADRNAKHYTPPPTPGPRDDELVIEEETGGRRATGDTGNATEDIFIPELKIWTYRVAAAGQEEESENELTVTLDPRFLQLRNGNNLDFFIQSYKYRFRVKFNLNGGTESSAYKDQIVEFGSKAAEPPKPSKEGCVFEGWYTFWKDGDEIYYNDWPYDFEDTAGVRSSFTLIAKWRETVSFLTKLNMADYTGINVYIHLSEGEDPLAYTVKTVPHKSMYNDTPEIECPLSSLRYVVENDAYYLDVMHTASTELTDTVSVSVLKDGEAVRTAEFSVYGIVLERLASGELDEVRERLNRALVQYGRYAQLRFDHKLDDIPAEDDLAPALTVIPDSYAAGPDPETLSDVISKFEAKIEMSDSVSMNVYLTPAAGSSISDFEISVAKNGIPYGYFTAPKMRGGKIFIKVQGILSYEMDNEFSITVMEKAYPSKTATWTRSLITCAYENYQAAETDARRNLMMSLYQYFLAARDRFTD